MYDTSLIKSSGGKGPLKLQQPFVSEEVLNPTILDRKMGI